jgi:prophage maintenance system killer protein
VREDVVLALHDEQLAEHGGAAGVRDLGLLQSALARPENLAVAGSYIRIRDCTQSSVYRWEQAHGGSHCIAVSWIEQTKLHDFRT